MLREKHQSTKGQQLTLLQPTINYSTRLPESLVGILSIPNPVRVPDLSYWTFNSCSPEGQDLGLSSGDGYSMLKMSSIATIGRSYCPTIRENLCFWHSHDNHWLNGNDHTRFQHIIRIA